MPPNVRDSRLPLKQLLGANLTWVRSNLGRLDGLAASMADRGQILPIITTSTYQVIDGARRARAAELLGWTDVRAIATDDFFTVRRMFLEAATLEKQGTVSRLPMSYVDLMDLLPILREIYLPVARVQAARTRRKGLSPNKSNYPHSGASHAYAELLGIPVGHIEQISRSAHLLEKARRDPDKDVLARVLQAAADTEMTGQIYALDTRMRRALLNPLPQTPNKNNARAQAGAINRAITGLTGTMMALPKPDELDLAHSEEDIVQWTKELTVIIQKAVRLRKVMKDRQKEPREAEDEAEDRDDR